MTLNLTHLVQYSPGKDAFTNSREALAQLLSQENIKIRNLKEDLALINYQHLEKFPDYVLSLSHTREAGAAVLAKKSNYLSLGIDIEWSDRPLREGSERFYFHPEDSFYENKLQLWTMKEAAFKALSPLGHPGVLVLSKIIIKDGVFYTNERQELKGFISSYQKTVEDKNLWVSIAYISA